MKHKNIHYVIVKTHQEFLLTWGKAEVLTRYAMSIGGV